MLTDLIDRLSRWKIVIGNETSDDSEDEEARPADQTGDDGGWDFDDPEPEPKKPEPKKPEPKKAEPKEKKAEPRAPAASSSQAVAKTGAAAAGQGRPSALTSVIYPVLGRVSFNPSASNSFLLCAVLT